MTTLTMKEEKRLEVIQRVFRGELTVVEAGMVIGVSERHCYRIKARVTEDGAKGVVHGNRGRPCKRQTKEKDVRRVVELAKGKYRGFNDRHLTEKLAEQEKLEISRETVRRILRGAGIASSRKRRGNKHRSRRERKTAEGMMHVLLDGAVKFFYQNEKIAGLAFDESFEPKDDRAVFYTHEIHSSKTSHQNSYERFTRSNSHAVRGRG